MINASSGHVGASTTMKAKEGCTMNDTKRFGRSQKIALCITGLPFMTSAVAMFVGKSTAAETYGLWGVLLPLSLAIVLGAAAYIKGKQ